jgi:hypothetical protein
MRLAAGELEAFRSTLAGENYTEYPLAVAELKRLESGARPVG